MKTTLRKLREYDPCKEGWKKLLSNVNSDLDAELIIKEILDSNGIQDAVWALRAVEDQKKVRLFCVDVAESVLHIFEDKYPNDKRPRKAIKASRKFANGEISEEDLAKFRKDAYTATATTDADAFDAAATTDAFDAAYAADAAAYTDSKNKEKRWKKIEQMLLKYL